jgi:uncharacterized protein YuzE
MRDVMYVGFAEPGEKASRTEIVSLGVHVDSDRQGRLIGIEVLDASDVLQHKVQFETSLAPALAD